MFGKNPVRKQDLSTPHALRVVSVFDSIQGEGPHAGCPAVFVRFAGCNLRCFFCDTDFETHTRTVTPDMLLAEIRALAPAGLVVLTGGEPLLQNITALCQLLHRNGYLVQVETAGTVWVEGLPAYVELVCSPKTPQVHPQVAANCRAWKYIVQAGAVSEHDRLPIYSTQEPGKRSHLYRPQHGTIYLQPLDAGDAVKNAYNQQEALSGCMKHRYRLSIQIHKILGVE